MTDASTSGTMSPELLKVARPGFRFARRHGSFDQCGRRPKRGGVVCGMHGGGHTIRQRDGFKLSPQEAGALSGAARRLKRDGRVDLTRFPASLPWLQERMERLREQPALVDLQEDILRLTALCDLVLSDQLDIDISDLVHLMTSIVSAKAGALKTKHAMELRNMVPIEQVRETLYALTGILNRYVPVELHGAVERELRTLGARQPEATSAPTSCANEVCTSSAAPATGGRARDGDCA